MTINPSTTPNLVNVRGTELLAGDTREQYRQKIARITLDSMVQFVGLLDAQGTVLEINQVALDAVGIKLSEVEGKPFWTTFWWRVSEEIRETLRAAILRAAQGEFVRWDTEIYGRAGGKETIIIDASLCPVKDEQGNVVFITAEGRDITEKKAHEREIARQREELAQLDKLKTQFFANISHEFRTPLTLMMGPLEDAITQSEGLSAANRERLDLAQRNSLRLLKLVNTLLDFSRIEAGRIQASYEPTDLAVLTTELASVFRSAIERAGMRLVIDCPPLPELVYVDREMWEKVVLNLLSNAFKFTFEGEIEISLRSFDAAVQMSVRDSGTGIPTVEIPRLFERFHRVKGSRGRSYEGSGIGLALVQELVKLHGGSVRVESAVDRGSTFIVSLPLGKEHLPADRIQAARTATSTALAAEAYVNEAERWSSQDFGSSADEGALPKSPKTRKSPGEALAETEKELILVADDNADMREYLTRLLHDTYRVHAVHDGVQAVEAMRQLRPALLLTDMMMPGLDGFGVLQAVRSDPFLSSTPVILLSARAGEESRVEGLQAGADDYLVKPFTARELIARVGTHVKMAELRRQTEKARRLYDTILSNTPDLAYVFDLNHRFIYANKALLAMWGRDWESAIGKNCLELGYEPWHAAMHDREIEQVIATKKPIRGEVPFTGTNGRHVYDYIFVPVLGPTGEVEAIAGTTRDITERTQAEDALRRSEERLRAFVNATSNAVYRMNADWTEMHHLHGKDFIADMAEPNRDWLGKYIHPDDQPLVASAIAEAIRSGRTFELEHRVVRVDGTLGWISSRAVPLLGTNGEVVEWFGAAADVTERKQAEEARHKLAAIVQSSDDAIISKDLNGIVTSWNAAAERTFGYKAEEMLGRSIATIIPPELQDDERLILDTIGRGERIEHFETTRLAKNGERLEVSLTISPVRNEEGTIIGAAKIARDVTQQKKTEQALRTTERLASVGRLAATVAHEINNPLEALTNLIYLAKRGAVGDEVRNYLSAAEEELERISHLTKQTLGFYRDSRAAIPTRLGPVMTSLVSVFSSRIRSKDIDIRSEIREDPEIVAIPGEIRQLLANLISNSIDAVHTGGRIRIRIGAAVEQNRQRRSGVRVTVADTGSGIPAAVQASLFQPFFTTKKDVGTGLGLWVSKGIVEKHGGSIHVRSSTKPGSSWTVFSVFLPEKPHASTMEQELKVAV